MVERWNGAVGPGDEVWHLGDFAVRQKAERIANLLGALNGIKHLITGNNDMPPTIASSAWASVRPYGEIEVDGVALVLCHYAFRTWRNMGKGSINLHGHSHGRLSPQPRQFDVGVDVWNFTPVTLSEIRRHTASRRRTQRARSAA